jgi:hypothetical protein
MSDRSQIYSTGVGGGELARRRDGMTLDGMIRASAEPACSPEAASL